MDNEEDFHLLISSLLEGNDRTLSSEDIRQLQHDYNTCKDYSSDRISRYNDPGRKITQGIVSAYCKIGATDEGMRLLSFSLFHDKKLRLFFEPENSDYKCLNLLSESKYQEIPIFVVEYLEPGPTKFSMVETIRRTKGKGSVAINLTKMDSNTFDKALKGCETIQGNDM